MTSRLDRVAAALHHESERRAAVKWAHYQPVEWADLSPVQQEGWVSVALAVADGEEVTDTGRRVPSWAKAIAAEVLA